MLLSLCDGMGSGENANRSSTLALNMVESFYRAGFRSDLILRSTNQLLTLNAEENFSAIDICVVDLFSGTCDMIKVGTPPSFIMNNQEITELNSHSLPLGILQELEPNINTIVLKDNDYIILATDGVVDSFGSIEILKEVIIQNDTKNPQDIANIILKAALKNYKDYPKDDMTVLVCKIFCKL